MCIVKVPNNKTDWIVPSGDWAQVRFAVEEKMGFGVDRCRTAVLGYLTEEDRCNKVALADTYQLSDSDTIWVQRYPLERSAPQWFPPPPPPPLSIEHLRGQMPPAAFEEIAQRERSRTVLLPPPQRGPHPSCAVIDARCLGRRVTPSQIEAVVIPECRRCRWILGERHRERECPTRTHPDVPSRWRGVDGIPAPTGVPISSRRVVSPPTTVEALLQVQWIDHDGRFWIKKHGDHRG